MEAISRLTINLGCLELFKGIMDNLSEGVYVIDSNKKILYWNEGAAKITGYTPGQAVGYRCGKEMLCHTDDYGTVLCDCYCPFDRALNEGTRSEYEIVLKNNNGQIIPVMTEVMPIKNAEGLIIGAAQVFRDLTRYHETEERLVMMKKFAMEDPVTLVGNRRSIESVLDARFREFERYDLKLGVIFADINNFKQINDTFGHGVGDQVLARVAGSLKETIRKVDTVGRWGGDEFVCVVPHTGTQEIEMLAERLRMNVRKLQIDLGSTVKFRPSVSVGTAIVKTGDTPDSLVQRADQLMYKNKRKVREYCFGKKILEQGMLL
jgi:diguanylate cyclase (GGDEF)-like protein/PAS domain S-box-containing protein